MLKLFLLRHATADSNFNIQDYDRTLTPLGIKQAQNVASHLPTIDLALCSSALRTKTTLETTIASGAGVAKTQYVDDLYNAPTGTLLSYIQKSDTHKNLLLVGHNPGIHQLAVMLSNHEKSTAAKKIIYDYPPASLAIFECAISDWKAIQPQENTLIDLIIPD